MKSTIAFITLLTVSSWALAQEELEDDYAPTDADDIAITKAVKSIGGAEKYLKAVSKVLSRQLPKRLDDATSLIGCSSEGKQLTLIYKLHKVQYFAGFSGAAARLQRYTTREICNSPEGRVLTAEFNVTYRYVYFGNSQKNLLSYEIDKSTCIEISESYERVLKRK